MSPFSSALNKSVLVRRHADLVMSWHVEVMRTISIYNRSHSDRCAGRINFSINENVVIVLELVSYCTMHP
jgi:hypothetical protein